MATTTTYELGVSGSSFIGAANREDLLDIITIISPVDTPLFTMFRKTKVENVQVEWLTDLLDIATSNAVADGSVATFQPVQSRERLVNYAQISRESYDVSDSQRAVNPAGIRDELRYQMGKAIKQWKRDVEYEIMNGSASTGAGVSTRCARGIQYWLADFSSNTAEAACGVSASAEGLDETDLNIALMNVWVTGGLCDYILATPTQKREISSNFVGSSNSRRNIPLSENTVINVIDFYMSDFGNVKVLPHRWFASAAPGNVNHQERTLAIQSDKWLLGFLRPPRNVPLAKVGSSERAMVEGEWTLISLHPSANTFVSGHSTGLNNFPLN